MKPTLRTALTWQAIVALILVLSSKIWAAGMVTSPVTYTLPPVHLVCTQTNQRTGTYARQGFLLSLRPNAVANVRLQGLAPMVVRVSGRQTGEGVELQYSVVAGSQVYGPSRLLLHADTAPVRNTFYMDDVALQLDFQPHAEGGLQTMVRPHHTRLASAPDQTTGLDRCPKCDGTGLCAACDGKGHEACHVCGGSGACQHCNGSGACHACGGTGQVYGKPCTYCHGTGNCQYCNDKGSPSRLADGRCAMCEGKGYLNLCAACGGNGKCALCHGTGKISRQ